MSATIRDVANQAGTSIATVSHVINGTRHVSDGLTDRVWNAIKSTGYIHKLDSRMKQGKINFNKVIAIVIPTFNSPMYNILTKHLSSNFMKRGLLPAIYCNENDSEKERMILRHILGDCRIAGIALVPLQERVDVYSSLYSNGLAVEFMDAIIATHEKDCVVMEDFEGTRDAVRYLISIGHRHIAGIFGDKNKTSVTERINGYRAALSEVGVPFDEHMIITMMHNDTDIFNRVIPNFINDVAPTAIISCGNFLTLNLIAALKKNGLKCPDDISIVGYGCFDEAYPFDKNLTYVCQDPSKMADIVSERIVNKVPCIGTKKSSCMLDDSNRSIKVPTKLHIGNSAQVVGAGPFGECATSPDEIVPSENERNQLKEGHYTVALTFHYGGTAWHSLHQLGITETLNNLGISVISTCEAQLDPQLQMVQIEGIKMQRPDAVIAIPVDDKITAPAFKSLSKQTKLVFLSNIPSGFSRKDYSACVSVNECESGRIIAHMIGDYFAGQENVQIGIIKHGSTFYGTFLRDMVTVKTIERNYPNIKIEATNSFINIADAYEICCKMLTEHPGIRALYVCWDGPALQAVRALRDLNRTDIVLFTCDLDEEIGMLMAKGELVCGISAQRPFEQGVAAAYAVAHALLGNDSHKYIGVSPLGVTRENLADAWKEILHEPFPRGLL